MSTSVDDVESAYDASRSYAFLTLSILISGDEINALANAGPRGAGAAPGLVWRREHLASLKGRYAESRDLQRAIDPMFEDIADRDRNLFIKDFLLDTPDGGTGAGLGGAAPRGRNVCASVALELAAAVRWTTEGKTSTVDLGGPIVFRDVLCRAFWMVHSNDALSYHLSFEVPFERDLRSCYGLSMLLKAVHPNEGTAWALQEEGWMVRDEVGRPVPLLAFVESLFERHAHHLFAALMQHGAGGDAARVEAMSRTAWDRLVMRDPDRTAEDGVDTRDWAAGARRRRLLVVLRDPDLFRLIDRVRLDPDLLHGLEPLRTDAHGSYSAQSVRRHFEAQAALVAATKPGMEALSAEQLEVIVFLSGFFQNIVDFLEQDDLEVHDGITPLYPESAAERGNNGYLLYATPRFVFEVVATSRSLDGVGRRWLGTCPYVFLVHVMALHNEGIVRTYEKNVSELIRDLELMGIRSDAVEAAEGEALPLGSAFARIKRFRLQTFEQVHKHLSFNIFRYETERTFFRLIEEVRGSSTRHQYWDGVLKELTEAVDSLKDHRQTHYGLRLGWLGFILALSGVLQVWFAIVPPDGSPWSLVVGLAATVLLVGAFLLATRRWFKPADAP